MSENEQPSSNEQQSNVGKKLRAAREAKGYTLDDLQQITKIQKRYLIAIEDDKFDQLPGDFYVRAFVKQYANTVGLDGDDLLKQYDDELPQTKTHEYSEHITQAVETRTSHHKAAEQMEAARRKYLPTIIIAVIVVLILGVIWITAIVRHQENSTKIDRSSVSVSGESSKKEKQSSSSSSKKTVKKTTSAVKLTEASRNGTSVTYNAKSLKKNTQLVLTTTGQSANSVMVDNTTRLNRTMNTNGRATVAIAKNASTVVIRIGTTANTKLKLGGKTIDFTSNNRYPQTRTVTIHFGNTSSSSSSSNSSSSNARTTTNSGSTRTTTTNNNGQRTTSNTGTTNTRTTTTNSNNSNQSSTMTNTQNRQQTTTTTNNNGGNSTATSNR